MRHFRKYVGFFLLEFVRVRLYLQDMGARSVLICLRLALPYSVFAILAANSQITLETRNAMMWAVLIGQILNAASMRLHTKIRDEVRTGDIATRLNEPVNYVLAKLFQSFGHFIPTFFFYTTIFGTALSFLFPTTLNLPLLIGFALISFLILNIVNIILGLISFLIEENDGIYWIVSKLFFVFGNQIIPVALMPDNVINIAKVTPFYLGLAGPIEMASGRLGIAQGFAWGIGYVALFLWFALFLLRRIQKRVILNG